MPTRSRLGGLTGIPLRRLHELYTQYMMERIPAVSATPLHILIDTSVFRRALDVFQVPVAKSNDEAVLVWMKTSDRGHGPGRPGSEYVAEGVYHNKDILQQLGANPPIRFTGGTWSWNLSSHVQQKAEEFFLDVLRPGALEDHWLPLLNIPTHQHHRGCKDEGSAYCSSIYTVAVDCY